MQLWSIQKHGLFKRALLVSKRITTQFDLSLVFCIFFLVSFGLLMVYSSSYIYAAEKTGDGLTFIKKQLLYSALGLMALAFGSSVPYRKWFVLSEGLIALAFVLLILVYIPGIGVKVGGARRWLRWGGFSFQPSEFAKFALLLTISKTLNVHLDGAHSPTWRDLKALFLRVIPVLFLLLLQPDFGSAAMIVLIIFCLIYLAGTSLVSLLTIVGTFAITALFLILGSSYRKARLLSFWDPWKDPSGKGFQIIQSFLGLHEGKFWGLGLGNGKEKLFYLPEAHNDFILSVIGEELGFLGILLVSLSYSFFIYRGMSIAWAILKTKMDGFAFLLSSGITLSLGLQAFVNMGVVLGLLPTKGLALPFVSYGGSALVMDLFIVGILSNISAQGRKVV